jgi:hypothetical protein
MMMSMYPAMALDSRHSTKTHTTTNQKQAATLDDRGIGGVGGGATMERRKSIV